MVGNRQPNHESLNKSLQFLKKTCLRNALLDFQSSGIHKSMDLYVNLLRKFDHHGAILLKYSLLNPQLAIPRYSALYIDILSWKQHVLVRLKQHASGTSQKRISIIGLMNLKR